MIDYRTQKRIDFLEVEVSRLRHELARRPLISVGGSTSTTFYLLNNITGGSTLYSSGAQSVTGIKYDAATSNTTVPNSDPTAVAPAAFGTGLGRATLLGTSTTVWVAMRPNDGTGVVTGITSDIPNTMFAISISRVTLTALAGDPTATVYIAYRF